jgi:sodium transport system permease protein
MLGMGKLTENRIRDPAGQDPGDSDGRRTSTRPTWWPSSPPGHHRASPRRRTWIAAIREQERTWRCASIPDFAEDWRAGRPALVEIIADTTRRNADIRSAARARRAGNAYSQQVGALRLLARGIDARVARTGERRHPGRGHARSQAAACCCR